MALPEGFTLEAPAQQNVNLPAGFQLETPQRQNVSAEPARRTYAASEIPSLLMRIFLKVIKSLVGKLLKW